MKCPVDEPIEVPSSGFLLQPSPELTRLLREEPVRKVRFPNGVEAWLVSGYERFRAVLADPRFTNRTEGSPPGLLYADNVAMDVPGNFFNAEGERHQHYRRKLNGEFMVKRIAALRPRIQEIVDEHLDDMARGPAPVDLVQAFTLPVPSMVIAELLGVPYEHRAAFQDAAGAATGVNVPAEEAQLAYHRLAVILTEVFDARQGEPREDVISRLIHEQPDLSREELTTICFVLLIGGHETTANFSSLAIVQLLQQPEQLAKLTRHPDRAGQVIDEILRYALALTGLGGPTRQALTDAEIDGQSIRAGEWVMAATAAANFDPTLCPHAERLDLDRGRVPHAVFGFGPHSCIGQNLARAKLEIMLVSLFTRFPGLRLAVPVEKLPFRSEMLVPGFHELPVTW